MVIKIRTRFFLAVEGNGEQSFIKWLQQLSDQNGLSVCLDCQPLNGGGYESMLKSAVYYQKRNERSKAKSSILLVDGDRAERDDAWSLFKLRQEAFKEKIIVCVQNPNQEGLLLRMMPGKENLQPHASTVQKILRKNWPDYQKPIDTGTLSSKFSLDDLLRAAHVDSELKNLLSIIGLCRVG
jgi:hypothetical protein